MCKQYRESTSWGTMKRNTDSDGTVTVSIRLDRTAREHVTLSDQLFA